MSSGTDRDGRTPAFIFFLVVAATLLLATPAGATDKCGEVGGETWTTADHPYVVTCDVTVAEGTTLTIEAGVEVRFVYLVGMIVEGILEVYGTPSDIVTFTTADDVSPFPGEWSGVLLDLNSSGIIQHALIEYGDKGINVRGDATVTLTGVTAARNNWGVYVEGTGTPSVYATGCTITDNPVSGVRVELTSPLRFSTPVTITDSELQRNGASFYNQDIHCNTYLLDAGLPPVSRHGPGQLLGHAGRGRDTSAHTWGRLFHGDGRLL